MPRSNRTNRTGESGRREAGKSRNEKSKGVHPVKSKKSDLHPRSLSLNDPTRMDPNRGSVSDGRGPPRTRYTPEDVRRISIENGFFCLNSKEFKKLDSKNLALRCKLCNKDFTASLRKLQLHPSCPRCGPKQTICSKEEGDAYAIERGGEVFEWGGNTPGCISKWRCGQGHVWNASWSYIRKNKSWCNKCKQRFHGSKEEMSEKRELLLAKKAWDTYRRRDREKKREFDLEVQDVVQARKSACTYCNRLASGLDRIDNAIGHIKSNCTPCCIRCNWVRGNWLSHSVMSEVGLLLKKIDP